MIQCHHDGAGHPAEQFRTGKRLIAAGVGRALIVAEQNLEQQLTVNINVNRRMDEKPHKFFSNPVDFFSGPPGTV